MPAIRLLHLCLILWFMISPAQTFAQVHAMPDLNKVPLNPVMADFYLQNKEEISALLQNVKNAERGEDDRLADFKKLRSKYPDYAIDAAAALVKDKSTKIAAMSVRVLGAAAVMSDHRMTGKELTANQKYVMSSHEYARKALRTAQSDERREVRDRATQTLASISDEAGLKNIVSGAAQGKYSDLEAVNHLGLANPDVGSKLVLPYLSKTKTPDVQAAAVNILSSSKQYVDQIRDDFLLNDKAPLVVRLTAAKNLAKDPKVSLLLLNNPDTPPELFEVVSSTYLQGNRARLSATELKLFDNLVDNYLKNKPGVQFQELKKQLNTMRQEKSP